ncbi:F-box domain-containing protein [Durusdinium trenchii]|uniref:F-box domain-containing protein n=1 Tax=Durusdinium trenchii TaxID=1381693 RepID=A0ABP0JWZ9_9DINO
MNRCPLDALCNCLAFSPLHERLRCASLARRWHEAVIEPSLWAQLVPEPEDLACLSSLLKRFGGSVRFLKIASHGPFRLSTSLNLEQLSKCSQLEELYLGGFRGRDLESFCQTSCQIDSLRALTIECDPYFNLGSFSHNTGAHMASLPAAWLSSFPNLERLVCDYLKLETNELPEACDSDSTSEPEEILWEVGEERAGEYLPGQGLQGGQGSPGAVRQADSEVPESADRAERSEGLEVTGNALLDAEHRTGSERLELPAAAVRREKARGSSLGEAGCDGHTKSQHCFGEDEQEELKVEVVKDDTGSPWAHLTVLPPSFVVRPMCLQVPRPFPHFNPLRWQSNTYPFCSTSKDIKRRQNFRTCPATWRLISLKLPEVPHLS